jgi:outer membrane protein
MRMRFVWVMLAAAMVWPASGGCLKLGYIDSRRIMLEYPDAIEAQGKFDGELKVWQEEAEAKQEEIQQLEQEYEAQKLLLSDETRAEKEAQIEQKKLEMSRFFDEIFGDEGRAARRNIELTKGIVEEVNTVLERLGEDEEFDMIMDAAAGGIVFAREGLDLTERVLEELEKAGGGE